MPRPFPLLLLVGLALPVAAAEKAPTKPADVFGLTKVWPIHITVSAKDWETMQPTRGGFGFGGPMAKGKEKPKEKDKAGARKPRGSFGLDFEYVKGDVEIGGQVLKGVGLRFKGGGTYVSSQRGLKRPFKIDFDRYDEELSWAGLKKLSLNNHSMDPTGVREALSYEVYRAAGVAAPRTAFAEVTLTVPGKHDKAVLGLYTLVEPVDKAFLKANFGSSKGMLLKPERVGAFDHLGNDWAAYESRYQPKTTASKKDQQRFIALTRLIHQADEETFNKEIGKQLDVERFLRLLATTVAISAMDSFLITGHNFYIYLDPKTDRFVVVPWDLDLGLGGFTLAVPADHMIDLSIRHPHPNRNRLIERLLADEKVFARYKKHLAAVIAKPFTAERLRADLAAITKVIDPIKAREKKAAAERKETLGFTFGGPAFTPAQPPALETFAEKRIAAIREQLDGKSDGTVPRGMFGPPPGPGEFLIQPALAAADANKDRRLSRDELTAGVKALFKALDNDGKGALDQKALAAGLEKLLPRPQAFGAFRPPSQAEPLARALVTRAGAEGKVTADRLVEAAGKLFDKFDAKKAGKLDANRLSDAMLELLPRPVFQGFNLGQLLARPALDAADKDKDSSLSRAEVADAAKAFFKACDTGGKGEVDEKQLTAGLDKIWPRPQGMRAFPTPAPQVARILLERAGKEGKVNAERLARAADELFMKKDMNKDGKLDTKELAEALNELMPRPRFGPPGGAAGGPPAAPPSRPGERTNRDNEVRN
jgi:spore coat protein CotH/Ca2+-binding EF-hand superfamily protein